MSKYREGDFLETPEGLLFGVKGILHPDDRVIAFLRYIPTEGGEREREGTRYEKIYPLESRFEYLRENHPKYLYHSNRLDREIQAVPIGSVENAYRPEKRLADLIKKEGDLTSLELSAVELSEKIIDQAHVESEKVGVTGSLLVGLPTKGSDIDLVIYGEEEGRKVYSALEEIRSSDEQVSAYDMEGAMRIAEFRWGKTKFPLGELAGIEKEKVLHGMFQGRDFFIRLVKDQEDVPFDYEDFAYFDSGEAEIEGIISDDADSIFTPNHYTVEKCQTLVGGVRDIKEIVSFRGRFAEQVSQGDKIEARGRAERVAWDGEEYSRLLLERPEDFLIPINHA